MAKIIEVNNLSVPELAPYAGLTHAQLRMRRQPGEGVFIAESAKVIARALKAGCRPRSFLVERGRLDGFLREMAGACGDAPVYTAGREVLAGLTGYQLTRGALCAMARPELPGLEEVCAGARRLVVLENITDAVNVGAIFRSAAALGMDGVLVTPTCCDPLYRRAVRVSMGAVFQIPWTWTGARGDQWPHPGLERLKALGFTAAAMALRPGAVPVDHPDLASRERLAVVLGSEGNGLTDQTIAACDYTVRIPMCRGVDSLNVAAAGAVLFWQLRPRP